MNSDRMLGIAAMMIAAAMAAAAIHYVAPVAYEPVGPRSFPLLLAGLMALCGLWLVIRPQHDAQFQSGAALVKMGLFGGVVLVYAVLFQLLGFVLATVLMVLPVGYVFGGTWRQCLGYGIALGVVLFVLFDTLLDVVLPVGVLKPVLSGLGL